MNFKDVTFKEWSAWIMLLGCTLAGLFYFGLLYVHKDATGTWMMPIVPLIILTVIIIAVSIIGHIIAAVSNPKDAMEPDDERDRDISLRASHLSGTLLGVGVIISLLLNAVSPDGNMLFHMVFASLLAGQIMEYVLRIIAYRKTYFAGDIA